MATTSRKRHNGKSSSCGSRVLIKKKGDSYCPSVHRTDDGGADDSVEGIPPKTKKGGSGTVACPSCKRRFLTFSGMRVHERAAHPVEFHAKAIAGLRPVKPRWFEEESRVIAEREAV